MPIKKFTESSQNVGIEETVFKDGGSNISVCFFPFFFFLCFLYWLLAMFTFEKSQKKNQMVMSKKVLCNLNKTMWNVLDHLVSHSFLIYVSKCWLHKRKRKLLIYFHNLKSKNFFSHNLY